MTTMELAVGLLTASLLAAILAWGVSLVISYTRCADTATAAARYAAIGDDRKVEQVRQSAPAGASVQVFDRGNTVEAVVTVDEWFGVIGPIHLVGTATQLKEPR
jgi:predicted neutral ceramidase superfamily lipid hydrolase